MQHFTEMNIFLYWHVENGRNPHSEEEKKRKPTLPSCHLLSRISRIVARTLCLIYMLNVLYPFRHALLSFLHFFFSLWKFMVVVRSSTQYLPKSLPQIYRTAAGTCVYPCALQTPSGTSREISGKLLTTDSTLDWGLLIPTNWTTSTTRQHSTTLMVSPTMP